MAYGVHLPQVPFPYLYSAKLPAAAIQPQQQPTSQQNFQPLRTRSTDDVAASPHIPNDTHRNNKPEEPNKGVDLHVEEQQQQQGQQHVKNTSNLRDYSETSDFGDDDENVEID